MLKQICFNSTILLVFVKYLFFSSYVYSTVGTVLINFDLISDCNKSLVILDFQGIPIYNFYFLHYPERLILDISRVISSSCFKKIPVNFSCENLIYQVRVDESTDRHSVRFMFNLVSLSCVDDVFLENIQGVNVLLLVITRQSKTVFTDSVSMKKKGTEYVLSSRVDVPALKNNKHPFIANIDRKSTKDISSANSMKMFFPIIVAIDAGHGGYDPGARGYSGLYEKNITMAIAKKFKKFLDNDPIFSPVMIRNGDYFISVLDRSILARSKGARVLLSIHADAISKNSKNNARGSSVWVLSDRGASIEMSHWLSDSTKWSQLSGEISNILTRSSDSPNQYFRRTILDLQLCHSQKVGYAIASHILRELKSIGTVHKHVPEYSNFGILRSLDIPSILVETGFITHKDEEKLLSNDYHQEKIACALYQGLRSYFLRYIACFENITDVKLHSIFRNYSKCSYVTCK